MRWRWFKIVRPATLVVTVCPVLLAVAMAQKTVTIDYVVAAVVMVTAVSLQVISNLVNDYYDFKRGSDTAERIGPERLLTTGGVTEKQVWHAILVTTAIAALGGLYLAWIGGWPILTIGAAGLICAWLYTATRYSFSYVGIADIFVFLFFGPIAVAGTLYLLGAAWIMGGVVGIGHGLITLGVLTVNNLRDVKQDAKHNKRTVIVRFGTVFGRIYYALSIFTPQLILFWSTKGAIESLLYLPFALLLYWLFLKAEGVKYNKLLALTAMLNIPYAALYLLSNHNL